MNTLMYKLLVVIALLLSPLLFPHGVFAGGATVNIQNTQFTPQQIIITSGSTVTWINQDSQAHTTTSDNINAAEIWDSGTIAPGQSFSKTFTQPGIYSYHCAIHPSMPRATIQVVEATQTAVTQLPQTGMPLAALLFAIWGIPLGFRLIKFEKIAQKTTASHLWHNRRSRQDGFF